MNRHNERRAGEENRSLGVDRPRNAVRFEAATMP